MPRARSRSVRPDLAGQQRIVVGQCGESADRLDPGGAQSFVGAGADARQRA